MTSDDNYQNLQKIQKRSSKCSAQSAKLWFGHLFFFDNVISIYKIQEVVIIKSMLDVTLLLQLTGNLNVWKKGLIHQGVSKIITIFPKTTPISRVSTNNLSFKPQLTRIFRFLVSKIYRQNPLVCPFLGFKNKQISEFCR